MFHTPLSTSELLTCSKVIDSIFDKKNQTYIDIPDG